MKRILALLMVTVFCFVGMTACGNSKTSKTSSNSTGSADVGDALGDTDGDGIVDDAITAESSVSSGTGSEAVTGNDNVTPGTTGNNSVSAGGTTAGTNASNGNGTSSKGNATSGNTTVSNPLKGVNLKGRTITIYTINANGTFNTKKGLSKYLDACATRMATIENALNCKVKVVQKTAEEISKSAYTTISSGDKFADLVEIPIYQTSAFLANGTAVNLKNVPNMDLSKSYLNAGDAVSSSTFFDKTYFVTSEDQISDMVMGYFFNKRILKETGLENPYTLVKNNKWTISKLRAMAKSATKDTDGKSGMSKNDQWGIIQSSYTADASAAVLASVGAEMLKKDSKKGLVYNMNTSAVLDAISLCTKMFVTDGTSYSKTDGDKDLRNMFMTGKSLFFGASAGTASLIMDMDDDFGFVPMPRGDKAKTFACNTNWNSTVFMVPKNPKSTSYSDVGYFLQAFAYLSQNTTTAKYKEYASRYFRDDESYSMFQTAVQSQTITAASIIGSSNGDWGIHEGTYKILYNCVPGTKSAKSEIETFQPFAKSNLEDFMYKLKKAK